MSNSLAAMRPELVREWSDKNLPLTPDKITYERQDYPGDDGALIVTFLQIPDTLLYFTMN